MQKIASRFVVMTLVLLAWSTHPHESHGAGSHDHPPSATMAEEKADAPIRMTMEQLHEMGGVPPGWAFNIPEGDPHEGRKVFLNMECYTCHRIAGEKFPSVKPDETRPGPDLTGMGVHHPRLYFAESIINPNRIVVLGEGYTGHDGLSIMPNYNDTLTVQQWIDLTAYLTSLKGPMKQNGMGHMPKQ